MAGLIAGVLLIFETSFFLISGWSPARFADPTLAIDLLRTGGPQLRTAAAFGFAGLIATVFLTVGLAAQLRPQAPVCASGQLYLGLVGIAGHSLVPLTLWIGVPAYLDLGRENEALAEAGWAGFAPISNGAHGVGSLFIGISMVLAGMGLLRGGGMLRVAGIVGLAAGALTVAPLVAVGTAAEAFAGTLFMPMLASTVLFRIFAGLVLWRGSRRGQEVNE